MFQTGSVFELMLVAPALWCAVQVGMQSSALAAGKPHAPHSTGVCGRATQQTLQCCLTVTSLELCTAIASNCFTARRS